MRVLTLVVALAAGSLLLALQQFDAAWGATALGEVSSTVVTVERLGSP